MRALPLLLLLTTFASSAAAQTVGQNKQPGQDGVATLSVRSQLVVEAVSVKNKTGSPVQGLKANDFLLTENGVAQKIRFSEHQTVPLEAKPLPITPRSQETITIYKNLAQEQIAPEQSEHLRYENRRLMAFYFDLSAMDQADQDRALRAAETFVRTQMTDHDLLSILRYNGASVQVLQDFTADRNRLLSILQTMAVGEGHEWATAQSDASSADTGAAFGQDDSEFNIFNTDRQLAALQTAAQMLGHLNEKKVLIYFAGGLRLQGMDNQAQLHATVDAAIRAGVSFWPIDARGLVAEPPMGDAAHGSPGGRDMYTGAAQQEMQTGFSESQDMLFALAVDTGGKALLDTNDLGRGIIQAQRSISDYYILGYYTSNAEEDGKFRHIKITITHPADARVEYRQGYYAARQFSKFTTVDKERQLEDALMLEDPITGLTIAMELNYFQLNRAEYFVPLIAKIPGSELALAKHRGADHALIDFIGEIKDIYGGTTVSNIRDNVNIKLTDETEGQLAHERIEYESGFTLLPGKYKMKILARDDVTGRIGTYETTFTIPNLNREEKRVPISSVVLSNEREDVRSAAYNAMKAKDAAKQEAINPLIAAGRAMIPSVTRVFKQDGELSVYLQGYEASTATPRPLVGYVSLYRAETKQLETQAIAVTPDASDKLKVVPLNFTIPLTMLPPGEYQCQVTVIDPSGGKSTFWRAPIKIDP